MQTNDAGTPPSSSSSSPLPQGLRVGFGYEARVGKDTAASFLISQYGGGVHLSFAAPLYEIQAFVQERCNLPKEKDRRLLQILGTEWGRERDPDIWVNLLLAEMDKLPPQTNVFITDVRFPNEIRALQNRGFILVHIVRPSTQRLAAFTDGGSTQHASELALKDNKDWDLTVSNEGTLDDFHRKLSHFFGLLPNRAQQA